MTEYQLDELDRQAREVRRQRLAVLLLILCTVLLVACGPSETEVRAGVSGESVAERSHLPGVTRGQLWAQTPVLPVLEREMDPPAPPAVVAPSPAASVAAGGVQANRALGKRMAAEYGWTGEQWTCLDLLWSHESGWDHTVYNRQGSGAYGIPQALPGHKMASHGADWRTNPATQIAWGLSYISGRYGSACGALTHSRTKGWY